MHLDHSERQQGLKRQAKASGFRGYPKFWSGAVCFGAMVKNMVKSAQKGQNRYEVKIQKDQLLAWTIS